MARTRSAAAYVAQFFAVVAAIVHPSLGWAQQKYQFQAYEERVDTAKAVTAHGPDIFGENVELQEGKLSFRVTDVSIPGNSSLPVAIVRSYAVRDTMFEKAQQMLADWEIEVPHLRGTFAPDWIAAGSNPGARCSAGITPVIPSSVTPHIQRSAFWQGVTLSTPESNGEVLARSGEVIPPNDGHNYLYITKDLTLIRCLSSIKNGSGEGFVAVTANGTKYYFDWLAKKPLPEITQPLYDVGLDGGPIPYKWYRLQVAENTLLATRVEDRFGNWVTYQYSNAANQAARLTQITSNDGRTLTVSYGGNGRVSTVSDGSRTWQYAYQNDNSGTNRPSLSRVTMPDGRAWQIDFRSLSHSPMNFDQFGDVDRSCLMAAFPANSADQPQGSITHPSGATATFKVGIREHGRSNVPVACSNVTTTPYNAPPGRGNAPQDDINLFVISYTAWTLLEKSVTGLGAAPQIWSYQYNPQISMIFHPGTTVMYPVCIGVHCSQPTCTNDSCALSTTTTVISPSGSRDRYVFGNSWRYNEGLLLSQSREAADGTALNLDETVYQLDASGQAYPASFGGSMRLNEEGYLSSLNRPAVARLSYQQGVEFASEVAVCEGRWCFDTWMRPTRQIEQSSRTADGVILASRTRATSYFDHPTKWVLGQVASVAVNGVQVSRGEYDPTSANLLNVRGESDQLLQTLTYHADGNVASVKDARNNTTTLGNWYRGVPRSIGQADGTTVSATVDGFGRILSATDELSATTSYQYDLMGRLTQVTHPTGDSTVWNADTFSFRPLLSSDWLHSGITAGQWMHLHSRGDYRKATYYDAQWRPVVELEYQQGDVNSYRQIFHRYDVQGRKIFTSYPRNPTLEVWVSWNDPAVKGTRTFYDALGRVTRTEQDSEHGVLASSTLYLNGFKTQITNPKGHSTTTSYQVFDSPDTSRPTLIEQPEGKTTQVTRDVFGRTTQLTVRHADGSQSLSRHYVYDGFGRLCKQVEPETGARLYDYDAAGNLSWSVEGSTLTSLTCDRASVPEAAKTLMQYDAMNRLTQRNEPGGVDGDKNFFYEPDGLLNRLQSWTNGGNEVNNRYSYNKRRMLVSESSEQVGWYNWGLFYGYNANGYLSRITYPSGFYVDYAPNALGQATQASSAHGHWASGLQYHPNGALKQFTYGNGVVHTMSQNQRQLPSRSQDVKGSSVMVDDSLSFDANGNVTTITDAAQAGWGNRTMQYDALDRLTQASAPSLWGTANYQYDIQDNLTRSTLGAAGFTYFYNLNNKVQRIDRDGGGSYTYQHDPEGQVTQDGRNHYQWDAAGRINTIFDSSTQAYKEGYRYDGENRRILAWTPSQGAILSMYGKDGALYYQHNEREQKYYEYVYLNGDAIGFRNLAFGTLAPSYRYQHTDLLGSPVAVTDESGTVIERTEYAPYGAPLNRPVNGVGYTGHVMDSATNLTYMQQRYYDPLIGRFLSADPMAVDVNTGWNANRYAYVSNNPYKFTDPDGRVQAMAYRQLWNNIKSDPAGAAKTAGSVVADFTPVVGDIKGGVEAYQNPTAANVAAAVIGLIPMVGDTAAKVIKGADKIADGVKLNKQLASEQQLGEVMSGKGEVIAGGSSGKELRAAPGLAENYGGQPGDWTKVTSSSHTAPDGQKFSTHAYQNQATGQVVEPKTKIVEEKK